MPDKPLPGWLLYLADQHPTKHKERYDVGGSYHTYLKPRGQGWLGRGDPAYDPSLDPDFGKRGGLFGLFGRGNRRGDNSGGGGFPTPPGSHGGASRHSNDALGMGGQRVFPNRSAGAAGFSRSHPSRRSGPPPNDGINGLPPPLASRLHGAGRGSRRPSAASSAHSRGEQSIYGMGPGQQALQFQGVGASTIGNTRRSSAARESVHSAGSGGGGGGGRLPSMGGGGGRGPPPAAGAFMQGALQGQGTHPSRNDSRAGDGGSSHGGRRSRHASRGSEVSRRDWAP